MIVPYLDESIDSFFSLFQSTIQRWIRICIHPSPESMSLSCFSMLLLSTLSTFTFTINYQLLCSSIQRQGFAFPRFALHPCTFTGPNPIPPWFALDGMFPKVLRFGNGNHMNGMDGVKGHGRNVSIFVAFPIGFGGFGFLGNGGTQIGTGQIQLSGTESI